MQTSVLYQYSPEALEAGAKLSRLAPGTVSEAAHLRGMRHGEPLILMLDCLLKYAHTYKIRFEGDLAEDSVLGDYWLEAIKAIHGLLNGDGVIAMAQGITTDSKDNGACEDLYWKARAIAGFEDETAKAKEA